MATYTVKTFNQSKILQEESKNKFRWFVSLPFTVKELLNENGQSYSDSILLLEEDFNLANAKVQVISKIQGELVRLAEHKEWQITV